MKNWQPYLIGIQLFLCCILLFSCGEKDRVIETVLEEFEVEDHLTIGNRMTHEISNMPETYNILDSVEYKDAYIYLNRLLSTLQLTSIVTHRDDFPWKVTILHDDNIRNAFTLPGGHIYVYTGLLKFVKTEHEFMAVLANEIAYADKELTAITLRDKYGGAFLGDIILKKEEVPELRNVLTNLPIIDFSEESVSNADKYAIKLICPFQYDINGLKTFLLKAKDAEIAWINSKKGIDLDSRIENLDVMAEDCGVGGVTNLEQYQRKIKNFLPN